MNDLEGFCQAVHCGAKVFAGPDTAKAMKPYAEVIEVESSRYLEEGTLWAIDGRHLTTATPKNPTKVPVVDSE